MAGTVPPAAGAERLPSVGRRRFTLRQLEVLVALAREGSVTAAAERLHLTQPAVSMQLRQLENAVGLALVEHVGRGLRITDAGRVLREHAEEILSRLDDFDATTHALRGAGLGRVRLGVVSTSKYFVPGLIALFMRAHPGVEFRLTVHNREEIIAALRDYTIDLGVMRTATERARLRRSGLAPNPLIVVSAPSHPMSRRRAIELSELGGEAFIVRERGSGTRHAMERLFGEAGIDFRAVMEADSNETIKQAVMAGMGIGFLSIHTVRAELAAGRIAMLDVAGLPLRRQWFVVGEAGRRLGPAAAEFREFLLREAEGLLRGGF
ncbi:MAG: LysR family transcriptional regulator [Burkholderiaceae bacterium]